MVEIAAQLGPNPTVCLDTYAHVMAEQEDGERVRAEERIALARRTLNGSSDGVQLDLVELDAQDH